MSNHITIELCHEDRERLDGLGVLLANLIDRLPERFAVSISKPTPSAVEDDDLKQKLAATLAKAKTAEKGAETLTEPSKSSTPADTRTEEETATTASPASTPTTNKATPADVRALHIKLVAAGKRDASKAVIQSYAPSIPELPADKCDEIVAKLTALEG